MNFSNRTYMAVRMITQFKNVIKKIFQRRRSFVRFYSIEPGVLELYPIISSSQIKRSLTSVAPIEGIPSVKSCPGIRKIISTGWIVTAPADFIIKPHADGIKFDWLEPWRFGGEAVTIKETTYISDHGPYQTVPLLDDPENMLHSIVKVQTPWRVESSDDILLLQLPVTYMNENRFYSATGIFDTRYAYNVNVQLFWKDKKQESLVRAGTPLCQLIPISRKYLTSTFYDVIIEDADQLDIRKEKAFVYGQNCVVHNKDNISSRLDRAIKIFDGYSKKEK